MIARTMPLRETVDAGGPAGPDETPDPLNVRARLHGFRSLGAGWLDGKGLALPPHGLDWLADAFARHYPADARPPYLFPTPEGNVLAEWHLDPWAPSLEVALADKRGTWHALNVETDEESNRDLDLTNIGDWRWIAEQIRAFGGGVE